MNMLSPAEMAQAASAAGQKKANLPAARMLALAILAGAYIALAGNLATVVSNDMSKYFGYGFSQFITGSVFTVGLALVIVAGAELFTGNNMMLAVAALDDKVSWSRVLYAWAIVYIGNFVGSLLVAWLALQSGQWASNSFLVGAKALATANAKVTLTWQAAFARGVLCNWMVCLAVWATLAAKDVVGKISALFLPIMGFVACGFEHSVANMYFIPVGIALSGVPDVVTASGLAGKVNNLNWVALFTRNLIPVTIGNIVGGALFVGGFYWFAYLRGASTPATTSASGSAATPR
ncbi:MAG: formate/nitrite transporter family protein [Ignavibacteriales bacterium]